MKQQVSAVLGCQTTRNFGLSRTRPPVRSTGPFVGPVQDPAPDVGELAIDGCHPGERHEPSSQQTGVDGQGQSGRQRPGHLRNRAVLSLS